MTPKQRRFVEEYLVDFSATQAAIRAGYSEKSAKHIASETIARPHVAQAIAKAVEGRSRRTAITADRVLTELGRIGFSDLRRVFTPGGNLLNPEDWGDDTAAAVASVKVVTRPSGEVDEDGNKAIEHVHEIKFWGKNSALEKIAKHLGMFVDRVASVNPDGTPVQPTTIQIVAAAGPTGDDGDD